MDEEVVHRPGSRWEVRVSRGSPRGDLFEMEVTTRFRVVDRARDEVALTLEGLFEETYRDGEWTDATCTGVRSVTIAPDDLRAIVVYADGRVEEIDLPEPEAAPAEAPGETPARLDRRPTLERIDRLLAYREALESPGRAFVHPPSTAAGPVHYPRYHEDVFAFMMEAGQPWWADYAYVPREAGSLVLDEGRVASATLEEIRTMLTWIVRGERFSDGHWLGLLESGRVQAVLRRLAELRPGAAIVPDPIATDGSPRT